MTKFQDYLNASGTFLTTDFQSEAELDNAMKELEVIRSNVTAPDNVKTHLLNQAVNTYHLSESKRLCAVLVTKHKS